MPNPVQAPIAVSQPPPAPQPPIPLEVPRRPQFPPSIFAIPALHHNLFSLHQHRIKRRESFLLAINSLREKLAQIDSHLCSIVGDHGFNPADMGDLERLWDMTLGNGDGVAEMVRTEVIARVAVEREVVGLERRLQDGERELEGKMEKLKARLVELEDWIGWALEEGNGKG